MKYITRGIWEVLVKVLKMTQPNSKQHKVSTYANSLFLDTMIYYIIRSWKKNAILKLLKTLQTDRKKLFCRQKLYAFISLENNESLEVQTNKHKNKI